MKIQMRWLLALVGCASGLLVANDSSADRKSYHGSICRHQRELWLDPVTGEKPKVLYKAFGTRNNGTATATVGCPLVRDRITSAGQLAEVRVQLDQVGSSLTCYLFVQYEDGNGWDFADYTKATSTTTGPVNMTLVDEPADIDTLDGNGNEASYLVRCALKPGDTIRQIHVEETNAND